MSRNVTILVIILVILLIAGYLVWLRGKFQMTESSVSPTPTPVVTEAPTPTEVVASPSASVSPSGKITTKPVVTTKPTLAPTKAATSSGSSAQ